MPKRRHTAEQIINKLRQAEVELSKGVKIAQVCRKLGVTEQTYYRWRKEYGGVRTDQAKPPDSAGLECWAPPNFHNHVSSASQ